jgi:RNA polymerase sigma-70 factor (ECF subfamily)
MTTFLRIVAGASASPAPSPRGSASDLIEDAALARLLAAGDARAAAALWDKYAGLVRGILRRMLGPDGDVDDLVQEAFLGLFRNLPGLRNPDALRSFVAGTAFRIARSEQRRRKSRRWLSLTSTGTVQDAPERGGCDPEARRAVKRLYEILDAIDDHGRTAFALRHFEGYALPEVALALGCSLSTAKRSLMRAEDRVNAMVRRDPLLAGYLREGDEGAGGEMADAAE